MSKLYWGYHLMLNCGGCDKKAIADKKTIIAFVNDLVELIDMVPYGEPIVEHFATHDPSKGGYTMIQMIETSHISGHFVDKDGSAYIDVFSCKPYNDEVVKAVVNQYFKPESINEAYLTRQA